MCVCARGFICVHTCDAQVDADGATDINDLEKLFDRLLSVEAARAGDESLGVAIGSRCKCPVFAE